MQTETVDKIAHDEKRLVWLVASLVATHADGIKNSDDACDWADHVLERYLEKFGDSHE